MSFTRVIYQRYTYVRSRQWGPRDEVSGSAYFWDVTLERRERHWLSRANFCSPGEKRSRVHTIKREKCATLPSSFSGSTSFQKQLAICCVLPCYIPLVSRCCSVTSRIISEQAALLWIPLTNALQAPDFYFLFLFFSKV